MDRLKLWALCAAVALYGLRGAPAPTGVGKLELVIGLLLFVAVGVAQPVRLLGTWNDPQNPFWSRSGTLILLWLLIVPGLRGLTLGWSERDVARDVIPLLFLFSPLVLVPTLSRMGPRGWQWLAIALGMAGLAFAARWWHYAAWNTGAVGAVALDDGPKYLLNAPTVLFTALAAPALALGLMRRADVRSLSAAFLLVLIGGVGLMALAGAVHRFALGVATVVLAILATRAARRSVATAVILAVAVAIIGIGYGDKLWMAAALALEKSRQVGVNARWDEAAAAIEQITRSPVTLLFGEGWGALIANPAVGGWRVSYTHTLFTYILIKGGLVGLAALAVWFGTLVSPVVQALRTRPDLVAAALAPVLMALTVHSSYKYIDTGLLLTLLILLAQAEAQSARKDLPRPPGCV